MSPRTSNTTSKSNSTVRDTQQKSAGKEASAQRAILAAVQSRAFELVYYLYGDDDYLKDAAIQDLLTAALDTATRDFNCEIRRASELDAESMNDVLGTPPMLAERRAVVIRDVGALKKGARQQLDKYLKRPATDTLLILVSLGETKKDSELAAQATALDFQPLTPDRVSRWIAHHVDTALHASISADAIHLLQQAVGNDLQLLVSELDKCASHAEGAHAQDGEQRKIDIDADTVSAVVGVRRGETAADLLDAVGRQDAATALQLVGHVLSQPKTNAVQIVIMLSVQAFALAYGRARREAGVPTSRLPGEYFNYLKETGGYVGRPWGEAASAWTRHVEHWNTRACERALALLLNADIALKDTSVSKPEQILTTLVLALCALRARKGKVA